LFFGNTEFGDLLSKFQGHYDTTMGGKREAESYRKIAADIGVPAHDILFLSDVVEELDAAREAGMQTGLSMRTGNAEIDDPHDHPELHSFAEVRLD
ncbi:MAG: hypothetical protein KDA60_10135, partial [Planctomycetales bacterium]|nr:hypothetical protein [Planctomycetales bacterium]